MEMSYSEHDAWNQRYSRGSHQATEPDRFLVQAFEQYIESAFPRGGTALDVAGGVGRHTIWMANRSWKVTLVDISEVGLEQAKKNAGALAPRIRFVAADLTNAPAHRTHAFSLGRAAYDAILVFFYLQRSLFPRLVRALKPGGMLIYKTYTVDQMNLPGGPSHPLHLLKHNELLRAFKSLRVLYYRETYQERGLAEFVGQK